MQTKSMGSILLKFGIFLFVEIVYVGYTKTNPQDEFTPPYDINVTLSPVPVKDGKDNFAIAIICIVVFAQKKTSLSSLTNSKSLLAIVKLTDTNETTWKNVRICEGNKEVIEDFKKN
jgi:hypothetical protein